MGAHTRLPRRYRGRDVMWWLDAMGLFDAPHRRGRRPAARDEPSMQLVGSADGRDVDLRRLQERGVRLVGRLSGVDGGRARFADDLAETTAAADARLRGLLDRIDAYAAATGLAAGSGSRRADARRPPGRRRAPAASPGMRAVIWATGYRRAYPWLLVPGARRPRRHPARRRDHAGARAVRRRACAGSRRRSSSFLDGVRYDAATVAGRILDRLGARCVRRWRR